MCQMRVVAEKDGREEVLLENVTRLELVDSGIAVTTLFEGSREFSGAALRHIDFLAGKVVLELG